MLRNQISIIHIPLWMQHLYGSLTPQASSFHSGKEEGHASFAHAHTHTQRPYALCCGKSSPVSSSEERHNQCMNTCQRSSLSRDLCAFDLDLLIYCNKYTLRLSHKNYLVEVDHGRKATLSNRNYVYILINRFPSYIVVTNVIAILIIVREVFWSEWSATFIYRNRDAERWSDWTVGVQITVSCLWSGLVSKSTLAQVWEKLWSHLFCIKPDHDLFPNLYQVLCGEKHNHIK